MEAFEVLLNYKIVGVLSRITLFIFLLFPKISGASSCYTIYDIEQNIDSLVQLALEHHKWAVSHHKDPGKLDSVILRTKLSLEIREQLWKNSPTIDLGKSYHNLGTFLKMRGDYSEAKKYLKEAVNVYTELEHDRVLRSLSELGRIYKLEGDFVSAGKYFKQVIRISSERGNDQKTRDAVINLGSTYVDAYMDTLAIAHLEEYIDYFDVSNNQDQEIKGQFYNNLASAYLRSIMYDKAISTYQKAKLYDTSNYITQAKIYMNQAICFRMKKEFKKCKIALIKGQEFAYKSEIIDLMSFSHVGFAKYYEVQKKHRLALSEYQKSMTWLIPSFKPDDDYSNPKKEDLSYVVDKVSLLKSIRYKAWSLKYLDKEKYKEEILQLFKFGDLAIDDMRRDHFIEETKLFWRSIVFPFYEEAIEYCNQEDAFEEAFYFFEKSKSVLLHEGYSFNEAISKTTNQHRDRYLKLKSHLRNIQKKNSIKLVDEVVNSQSNFEMFTDSLSIAYPDLFKAQKKQSILSLPDFQDNIVQDSSIIFIHYFFGRDSVFAYGIEKDEFDFLNLGSSAKLDSLISILKDFYLNPSKIDNDFNAYKEISHLLYEKLLAPLIRDGNEEVVIMPDGSIATIPFESLISYISEDQEMRYVIQDRVIRYSFSGSILNNMNDAQYRETYDVVSFVPFGEDESMKNVNFSGLEKEDFKNAEGLDIQVFSGKNATKENLFSFGKRLPILHFSSHGFSDAENEPKILLSNSSLSLSELFTSSLPSDMVFLSACQTNVGENVYGEGIQSMARGFTFAGANSVVSSLWNVIANPNSKIVKLFYKNLSLGQFKHLALHNAKLAYLEDPNVPLFEKSPYYWAGLVYYGESDHILKPKRKNGNNTFFMGLTIAFLLMVCFFGFKTFQRWQA